eukprot:1251861-Prymnesium_polylepis.2
MRRPRVVPRLRGIIALRLLRHQPLRVRMHLDDSVWDAIGRQSPRDEPRLGGVGVQRRVVFLAHAERTRRVPARLLPKGRRQEDGPERVEAHGK